MRQTLKEVEELAEYDSSFRDYLEGLESARAVLEDLSFSLRDFADRLEFSPARLAEIEDRLAELSRLKRKYGGSIEASLEHLARVRKIVCDRSRLPTSVSEELNAELAAAHERYLELARKLHKNV